MKTPRKDGRVASSSQADLSLQSRRKRTLALPACESLEGRKLMTGFAGPAGGMMGGGFAQMGDMTGGNYGRGGSHHFSAGTSNDSQGGAAGDWSGQSGSSNLGAGRGGPSRKMDSLHGMDASRGDNGLDGGFGGDLAGGLGGGPGGDFGGGRFGGDAANIPMSGQSGSGDQSGAAAANTPQAIDFAKLRTDAQAIHDKSQVTPALEAAVRKDFEAIAKAATGTADATTLKTLQTDQQAIFSSQTAPSDAQKTQLQADRDAVLKSQGVSQTLIDQLATDKLAVKTASNFTPADQATLDADRAAIKKDLASTPPASTSSASNPTGGTTSSTPNTPSTTPADPASLAASTPAASTPAQATAVSSDSAPAASTSGAATPAPSTPTPPVAASTPTPTTPTPTPADPTMTTTSTAAPSLPTGMGMHSALAHMERAQLNHHGETGHHIQHSTNFGGQFRRGPRR